jgi:hypothetical protein
MDVDLYADPGCAWSWAAYRWLDAVASRRQLRTRLRPFSLLRRDGVAELPEFLREKRRECHRALRVCAAIADEGQRWSFYGALCDPIYAALRTGRPPSVDVPAALAAADLAAELAAYADDESVDAAIDAAMTETERLLPSGEAVQLIPIVVLHDGDEALAVRGPLLDPEPRGRDAVLLWDAVERLVTMPNVYEISRPRPGRHSFTIAS